MLPLKNHIPLNYNEETITRAEKLQEEMHLYFQDVIEMKQRKMLDYDSIQIIFLLLKIAQLETKISQLTTNTQ